MTQITKTLKWFTVKGTATVDVSVRVLAEDEEQAKEIAENDVDIYDGGELELDYDSETVTDEELGEDIDSTDRFDDGEVWYGGDGISWYEVEDDNEEVELTFDDGEDDD